MERDRETQTETRQESTTKILASVAATNSRLSPINKVNVERLELFQPLLKKHPAVVAYVPSVKEEKQTTERYGT